MDYSLLGYRIRQIRIGRHISQQQMAKKLNFSLQHIGNVERGIAHPSLDLLVDISNVLNISIDYLLQDSLNQNIVGKPGNIISDVQYFLDQQEVEIQVLQKIIHDL